MLVNKMKIKKRNQETWILPMNYLLDKSERVFYYYYYYYYYYSTGYSIKKRIDFFFKYI